MRVLEKVECCAGVEAFLQHSIDDIALRHACSRKMCEVGGTVVVPHIGRMDIPSAGAVISGSKSASVSGDGCCFATLLIAVDRTRETERSSPWICVGR
jgi:hypothetical protein